MSVFVGTSLDGFIAPRNGPYDFLPAGGGEPHGYDEFIASVDTILIGRNTFEVVLKLPRWPYIWELPSALPPATARSRLNMYRLN
jgi:hypothetical protein